MDKIDYSKDYVCGCTGLPCIACNPGACEHRKEKSETSKEGNRRMSKLTLKINGEKPSQKCLKDLHAGDVFMLLENPEAGYFLKLDCDGRFNVMCLNNYTVPYLDEYLLVEPVKSSVLTIEP